MYYGEGRTELRITREQKKKLYKSRRKKIEEAEKKSWELWKMCRDFLCENDPRKTSSVYQYAGGLIL